MLLRELVEHAANRFEEAGIDSASVDAELLAGHVLGLSRGGVQSEIIRGAEIADADAEKLLNFMAVDLVENRCNTSPARPTSETLS